jgi:hypothetical protein
MIFGDVFAPETVAYVSSQVREAILRLMAMPDERQKTLQTDLVRARAELDNIAEAIRRGLLSDLTRQMLADAERRVAELEAAVRIAPAGPPILPPIEGAVEVYLRDLRATLETDAPRARELLARGIGSITLRPVGKQLVAELQGNLAGLLGDTEPVGMFPNDGAGSPSHIVPYYRVQVSRLPPPNLRRR